MVRRRRRGENITQMTNRTDHGRGGLRRGTALPKERHPPGRWSGKTPSPATPSLGPSGESPRLLVTPLPTTPISSPVKRIKSPRKSSIPAARGDRGAKPGETSSSTTQASGSRAFSAGHFHPQRPSTLVCYTSGCNGLPRGGWRRWSGPSFWQSWRLIPGRPVTKPLCSQPAVAS